VLIKQKDSLDQSIQQLEAIAQRNDLPRHILDRAQIELRTLKAGMHGENNAAYFINFDFANRKSWAIIHDLRLEHRGYVAQIDHLLISRLLEFYVLESKHFATGIKITDRGEFLVYYNGGYIGIESPIEQNKRHGRVLWMVLQEGGILPTRLGLTLQPRMISYVLVSPKSVVNRPPSKSFNTDMVVKSDVLSNQIEVADAKMGSLEAAIQLTNLVSSETLEQIARKLVALHKPAHVNYYAKFGITSEPQSKTPSMQTNSIQNRSDETYSTSAYYCFKCRKLISQRVATFCFDNKKRFGGRAYCFDCQKSF
jgi:hypothetical protein